MGDRRSCNGILEPGVAFSRAIKVEVHLLAKWLIQEHGVSGFVVDAINPERGSHAEFWMKDWPGADRFGAARGYVISASL
ncbi:MAG: hypothetical protein PHR35_21730 [Kiritimatiellae bacterium]|nr:hypothetical protein [Kiritimatiellia bacterium]